MDPFPCFFNVTFISAAQHLKADQSQTKPLEKIKQFGHKKHQKYDTNKSKKKEEESQKNYMNTSEIKAAKKLKLIKNTNQNIKYLINRKLYIYI